MAFLNYEYKMKISYSEEVKKCYFTLKSIPANDFRQIRISQDIHLIPPAKYSESQDSFGNIQIIGSEDDPHQEFVFLIKGMVETHPGSSTGGVDQSKLGMYKYPHGKCIPGETIEAFAQEIRGSVLGNTGESLTGTAGDAATDDVLKNDACVTISDKEKCFRIMQKLWEHMVYETGSTEVETTAEESFASGKGVCQDFSHIYICLLRLFGIPARYVCGLIVGEGQSHAWVEAACDGNFVAFDPTHNREITDEYIKLGVGRDAGDCAINRGVMWGGGKQTQEIEVTVEKYY